MRRIIIYTFFSYISPLAWSNDLSQLALYHRCYTQITTLRASDKDSLTKEVVAGTKTAAQACLSVLKKAKLNNSDQTQVIDVNDVISKKVLSNFHHLHTSWFYMKDFPVISWGGHNQDIKNLYDTSTPALYITRALFKPGSQAKEILTSNDFLMPIRTNMDVSTGPSSGRVKADYIFANEAFDNFSFAPVGELLGVKSVGPNVVNYPAFTFGPNGPAGSIDLHQTLGGGFLGTQPYLLLNIGAISSYDTFKTDGGLKMHRKWGKAVYRDTLCRDLPVVREKDVLSMVDASSSIPFRNSSSCTKCHASHDRISGVIRGLKVLYVGHGDPGDAGKKERGGNFGTFHSINKESEPSWPINADVNYFSRPTNGVLFFRNYEGDLVSQNVTSVTDLAAKISDQDDFYICLAKRYYSYFTGIDVDTGDLDDPGHSNVLSSEDLNHRKLVISLGKKLKTSQDIMKLIEDILNLENYKKSDFGAKGGLNVK